MSEAVALYPGKPVDIVVTFSASRAGHAIAADPLDGGSIIGSHHGLVVAPDGTISFKFKPGNQPGVSQIVLRDGGTEFGLQFWVIDLTNPANNPPASSAN